MQPHPLVSPPVGVVGAVIGAFCFRQWDTRPIQHAVNTAIHQWRTRVANISLYKYLSLWWRAKQQDGFFERPLVCGEHGNSQISTSTKAVVFPHEAASACSDGPIGSDLHTSNTTRWRYRSSDLSQRRSSQLRTFARPDPQQQNEGWMCDF